MPNTYNYVNTQGGMSTVQADTAEQALSNATNRMSDSGVQLVTPTNATNLNTPTVQQQPIAITPQALAPVAPVNVPMPTPSVPTTSPNYANTSLNTSEVKIE